MSLSNFYGDPEPFAVPDGTKVQLVSVLDRTCIDSGCHEGGLSSYTNTPDTSPRQVFRPLFGIMKQPPW